MKRFVILLLSSIVLTIALASPSWAQNCDDCIPIPRKDFELAKKAADEAESARDLIAKQSQEIDLLRENSQLKDRLIQALRETSLLKDEQLAQKEAVITAERTAREMTERQLAIETREKLKAQGSAKVWRKIGTVAGGVAAVLLFGALH